MFFSTEERKLSRILGWFFLSKTGQGRGKGILFFQAKKVNNGRVEEETRKRKLIGREVDEEMREHKGKKENSP